MFLFVEVNSFYVIPAIRLRCCAASPDLEQDPAKSEGRRREAGIQRRVSTIRMSHARRRRGALDPGFRRDDM